MDIVNFNYSYINAPNTKINERFRMEFKPIQRDLQKWKIELINTAKAIYEKTTRPIYLCLSGGIDSEVMALAFLQANVPFKALTIKHQGETNLHDITYAEKFCLEKNIEQVVVEVDILTFFEKYLPQYRATSLFRYLQLFILETVNNLGGCAVLGGGEQVYYTVKKQINIKYDPGFLIPLEWCKRNSVVHYPYFHMHNPELMASYMSIDLVSMLLRRPFYFKNHHYISIEKILVYNAYWPSMARRAKFNGFEQIRDFRYEIENGLKIKHPDLVPMYIPVSDVKSQLGI